MILLCYDGSADAQAAIDHCALLMPGSHVEVLVVWETILETMTRTGAMGMGFGLLGVEDDASADAAIEKGAQATAAEGAQRAIAAGLLAQPREANCNGGTAETILAVADDLDADVIVLGTRGRGNVKSLMLGSVSHAVLHHADRSVLVVPSASLAEQRHNWAEHAQITAGTT